jgi:hypothetical protein
VVLQLKGTYSYMRLRTRRMAHDGSSHKMSELLERFSTLERVSILSPEHEKVALVSWFVRGSQRCGALCQRQVKQVSARTKKSFDVFGQCW